ncbi:MAG TPA: HesA/MoeB/ThiF family protein, partial [Planctomycetota bacterium]|nr:HesA/MoeB/ThiF family protein [Planctomycetota bacterium]
MSAPAGRFARQERLPQVGEAGQRRLAAARVAIVGVGASGSHLAEALGRAGVGAGPDGWLRLIDRDVVEVSNLPRQQLFTDADAEAVRPKAQAAAEALLRIDPSLHVQPRVHDVTADDVARLLEGAQLVLDGTDNFPTRFLLNDACVSRGVTWIYCGVVGTEGQALVVRPEGPCLRCYVPEPPPPGSLPTCDTAGVLGSVVGTIASLAATLALRELLGAPPEEAP